MPNPLARTPANTIWKMYAIQSLYWMHFISSVLIPFFQDWGGLSFTGIMLLNAWFMLWNFLLEITPSSGSTTGDASRSGIHTSPSPS